MQSLNQLRLLLWKNFVLQRRQWIWTLSQIFLPILFSFVLLGLRQAGKLEKHEVSLFRPFRVTGNLVLDGWEGGMYTPDDCFFPTDLAYAPSTSFTDGLMDLVNLGMKTGLTNLTSKVRGMFFFALTFLRVKSLTHSCG